MEKTPATANFSLSTPTKLTGGGSSVTDKGQGSVQIMAFEEVTDFSVQKRKAIMLEKKFRKVIDNCTPGAPVAVLAIAGKANKGKSLFLSFVLRYLKALQTGQNNADWMGWSDKEERPLQGFKWANGYEVVTEGIWAWSEPISIRNSKGQVFDVLLLDTQGVFDEETGQREWNVLAGLALLTSSVMILNASQEVQEDTLELLQNSLSFGLMALDRESSPEVTGKPFQNLVFLVRDWENPQQFPFGKEGGKKFIERKLQEKPIQDESHRHLRRHMKTCFESIDCFVFPHPGDAVRESSFTGSLLNATKEYRFFAQHVQQCIEQLLNPDHFPFKTLNGNVLTGSDVLDMFRAHVEIFNSDDVPSSRDLFNAAAHRCNAMINNRCVTAFVQALESSLSSVPFLTEQEFATAQKAARETALAVFKISRKMGDSQVIATSKVELESKLGEKISHFKATNQNKLSDARKILEEKLDKIVRVYEAELESKVGDNVLNLEAFLDVHIRVASNARQKFQSFQWHPALESEGLAMLDSEFKNVDRWVERVKKNAEMAQQALSALIDASAIEYWNALSSVSFKDLTALEQVDTEARGNATEALKRFPRKLDEMTFKKVQNDMALKLNTMYEKIKEALEKRLRLEREQTELQMATEDAVRQYRLTMMKKISCAIPPGNGYLSVLDLTDVPVSTVSLAHFHSQCESHALKCLSSVLGNTSPQNAKLLDQQSKAQLCLRISQEFSNLKRLNDKKLEILEAELSKFLNEEQKQFRDDLQELTNRFTCPSSSVSVFTSVFCNTWLFVIEANKMKDRVEAKFHDLTKSSVLRETDFQDRLSTLKSQMENLISVNKEIVELKRKEEADARQVEAQTAPLRTRLENMQRETEEEEQRLWGLTQSQGDAIELLQVVRQQQRRLREAQDPCVVT